MGAEHALRARVLAGCAAPALLLAACAAGTPDIRDPGPDFGYVPNAIGIVQPGRSYLETAAELRHGPGSEDRGQGFTALGRAGVAEDWELRLQAWPGLRTEDADGSSSGVGPLQVGFKHRLSRGDGRPLAPAYGFEVEVLLPTGSSDFDQGKVEPGAWVNVDHTTSETGTVTWNAGFQTPVDVDGHSFLQGYAAWAYTHALSSAVQLYVTGDWNHPSPSGSTLASLGAGLYWTFSSRVVLIAGYDAGLTSETPDGLATLGLSFAF